MSVDDLLNKASLVEPRRARAEHPNGWTPGVHLEGNRGEITTRPTTARDPSWDDQLRHFGFDPAEFEILEPINVRTWDAAIGNGEVRQMWYYRANIIRRQSGEGWPDVETQIKEIKKRRPISPPKVESERALIVNLADWQVGKSDFDGTEGVVARALALIGSVTARAKELKRLGRPVGTLYVAAMGDLIENVAGHYEQQTFSVELDRRSQAKVARRLLVKAFTEWARHFPRIVGLAVAGNHPENRQHGKSFTTFGDNDDLAIMEQVAEILGANPDAFGHVSFVVPDNELSVTLEINGNIVTFAHGHQFASGKDGAWKWWDGHARGMTPPGDATILVSGHFHHFSMRQEGPRTHLSCPTLESGSQWYSERHGTSSPPGTLTFTVGPDGWGDVELL